MDLELLDLELNLELDLDLDLELNIDNLYINTYKFPSISQNIILNFDQVKTRGNCNPPSHLETRRFKMRHFEKPHFPCFQIQKLD